MTTNQLAAYVRTAKRHPSPGTHALEEPLSISAQRSGILQFCDLHELGLPLFYEDSEVSGKSLNRPGLQRLLTDVRAGKVTHVVVTALDRLSRRTVDAAHLAAEVFPQHGVRLSAVNEDIDTDTEKGRASVQMLSLVSAWERDTISERTRDALAGLQARGVGLGARPFGDAADEADALAVMVQLRAEGYTLGEVCAIMRDRGIRNRRGRTYTMSAVSQHLSNWKKRKAG